MRIAKDSLSFVTVMFLWAQMAADSSAIRLSAAVGEDSFSLDTCGLWWNVSQQGLVPTFGSSNAVYCCHLQGIRWPQQLCFVSSAAAQFNLKPSEILVGAARCVATQTHEVLCLCNGSREGPSIKPAQRQPVCRSCVVCLFLQSSAIQWGNMFYIYISFFWGRKLQLDVIGSVRVARDCITMGQLHISTPQLVIHVETMRCAVPN